MAPVTSSIFQIDTQNYPPVTALRIRQVLLNACVSDDRCNPYGYTESTWLEGRRGIIADFETIGWVVAEIQSAIRDCEGE